MTWREQLIAKILLIVARIVSDDVVLSDELRHLTNHISARVPISTPTATEAN